MIITFFQPSDVAPGSRRQKGFTLLELLISMTLFLFVVVILGGALRLGFRSISAGEKKIDVLERFRSSFGIITNQLQSAVPLTYDEDGAKKYYLKGDAANLQFATSQSIWGREKGCVIVSYRLEPADEGQADPLCLRTIRRDAKKLRKSSFLMTLKPFLFPTSAEKRWKRTENGRRNGLTIPSIRSKSR